MIQLKGSQLIGGPNCFLNAPPKTNGCNLNLKMPPRGEKEKHLQTKPPIFGFHVKNFGGCTFLIFENQIRHHPISQGVKLFFHTISGKRASKSLAKPPPQNQDLIT